MGVWETLQPSAIVKASKRPHRVFKRAGGPITKVEKDFVAQFVQDQPAAITPGQVRGLAQTLRRSKAVVIDLIEQARERFVEHAEQYVVAHQEAVRQSLANGDAKSLEVARRGAEWAMENLSHEGTRIVEKAKTEAPSGTKIMIGVRIGGIDESKTAIAVQTDHE